MGKDRRIHFRDEFKEGMIVGIVVDLRHDVADFQGEIIEIISPKKPNLVEDGVEVRLKDGTIGHVIEIIDKDENKFNKIIQNGESKIIEFKETFQYDVKKNVNLKCLADSSVKTIAAFANTEGGTLIIGVNDANNIVGLERDYRLMNKRESQSNKDKFEQIATNYIRQKLGTISKPIYYNIEVISLNNKDVCIIEVQKSRHPVFVKNDIKYTKCGNNNLINGIRYLYYVREGTESIAQELDNIYLESN